MKTNGPVLCVEDLRLAARAHRRLTLSAKIKASMAGKRSERVGERTGGQGRGGGEGGGLRGAETTNGSGAPYRQPRSMGGGETPPQDLGAHLWVHTDEPTSAGRGEHGEVVYKVF